ncbi:hypothetical protein HPULCUR_008433 [Helicostylum pulchrum]|uniref:Uncharacterized protein n=1 Tax=Helicostylum pulchrum TaxID=562976 RepID=A0ABP9Y8N3_9FUNG
MEFCDSIKAYIVQFDSEKEAKVNLQNKFKIDFSSVKEDSRRGPGVAVDIQVLFAGAKAGHSILAEGWNTLGSAVARVGSQMKEGLEADLSNNVELNEPSDEEEAEGQDDDYVKNKFNISAAFRQYKSQREKKAKQEGFYVDGNLHQILSLHHGLCPMTKRRITKQLINGIANNADDEDDMMNVLRISLQHTQIDCFI